MLTLILFEADFIEHDVGLFKFKLLSFSKGVNVFLKLLKCDISLFKSIDCVLSDESTDFISNNIPTTNFDIVFFFS